MGIMIAAGLSLARKRVDPEVIRQAAKRF